MTRFTMILLLLLTLFAATPASADTSRAVNLYKASRFKEAIEEYEKVLPTLKGREAVDAQYSLAMCYLRAYKREGVVEQFQKLLAMEDVPDDLRATAWYQTGIAYGLIREYEKALLAYAEVEKIEGIDPSILATARQFAGHSLYKLDRLDDAIASYLSAGDVAEAHFVTRQTAYVAAGAMYQVRGEYDKAIVVLRKAVALGETSSYGKQALTRIIECETAMGGSDGFYILPYVTNVTTDRADVYWISRENAPLGRAEAVADNGNPIVATSERAEMKGRTEYRQSARLTGLLPGTRYHYRATCENETHEGTFLTAPTDHRPIRFAVIGDTQGGHDVHEQVAAAIAKDKPDFVVHVGDCVERGDRWDEWKVQVFDPGNAYLKDSPIYPARGNHDGGPYFRIFFGRHERLFEDFRFGDVHLFVMDSQSSTGGALREQQLTWLDEAMGGSDAKWKIVALHHPMIHVCPPWQPFGQKDFLPIIEKHGGDVVLTGHYHIYQRLIPIGMPGMKPVLHITSGGGGGNMGFRSPSPLVVIDDSDHHHLLFTVNGDTLDMQAKRRDGTVFDTMQLIHSSEGFQPEVMAKALDTETAIKVRLTYHSLTNPDVRVVDLVASAESPIAAGESVTFRLHNSMIKADDLPVNTTIEISQATDNPWKVEPQIVDPAANPLLFKATAPENTGERLRIRMVVRVGDRELEPDTFNVLLK